MSDLGLAHTLGAECINIHSDRDISVKAQNDRKTLIGQNDTEEVTKDKTVKITGTHTEEIKGNTKITIKEGTYEHDVGANTAAYHVKGKITEIYDADQDTTVTGQIKITATTQILLQVGESKLLMKSDGSIELSGKNIKIIASQDINASAPKVAVIGTDEALIGVGFQKVTCNKEKVISSGAGISATAVGTHEISGALVKIN
jgi:Uncharacterized protein conserved in bacteria